MPFCDTPAMQAHLAEISAMVAPGAHAILILDQAGERLRGGGLSEQDDRGLHVAAPPRRRLEGDGTLTRGAMAGERQAARTKAEAVAARAGMTLSEALSKLDAPAPAASFAGFDD